MPHAPFLFMSWLTSCLPSPCRRLSRPRTTTKAPLPCRIFSVIFLGFLLLEIFHLAALRIAGYFRRSGLGNLQLDTLGKAYCDVGVGFRPFPLTAADLQSVFSSRARSWKAEVLQTDRYNYLRSVFTN